ncbi:MAG TPA: hypothetical protein PKE40_01185 [Arachnia sp.]|nr:hypothetical protein [Arachnia sp.]HMT84941.1 hypothetical protein [Arachnia sp.]
MPIPDLTRSPRLDASALARRQRLVVDASVTAIRQPSTAGGLQECWRPHQNAGVEQERRRPARELASDKNAGGLPKRWRIAKALADSGQRRASNANTNANANANANAKRRIS